MDDGLSVIQISRLSHWLQSQGMTPEQILDCIDYIAKADATQPKMSGAPVATNNEAPDTTKAER